MQFMYLKRLDIQGFKSFPDKLKLEFNGGITAVVGPNGSGKSNISDAVRWVLGEQSAKSLRGIKMEDIIFTGTANRKPLGFAEVSITLDNVDKSIPIEFSEITVTRRVYRSGESEYQLNGTLCRLKDVHELFTDTGIGKEGYSIIGQGRIDEILSTKSEDRRNMFEEAAGILKFKNRREEAKVKLERERQNLVRVYDIISTLEGQVEPLRIQCEKSKRYLQLRERLKLIEINMFIIDVEKIDKDILEIENSYSTTNIQIENEKNNYEKSKKVQQDLKDRIEYFNTQIQETQKEFYDIISETEKNEGYIKLIQEQINHIFQDIKRIQTEIYKKNEQLKQLNENKNLFSTKYNSLIVQLDGNQKLLDNKQKEFYKLNSSLNENETLIESYNLGVLEKTQETANAKNDIQNAELLYSQLYNRKEQIIKEKNYNLSQINDKNIKIQVLEKSKKESLNIETTLLNNIENTNQKKILAHHNLQNSKKILDELNSNISQYQSNYNYLQTTQKEHRGFTESVKNILKVKDLNPEQWKGIYGVVGEVINVAQKYETAIEIALGGNINNIITSTEEYAKKAIEYLKETKSGRATFFPLSVIKSKYFDTEKSKLILETGVVGIASDIINYDILFDNVIKNLLGKVIIMDNLTNAILLSKKYKYSYRIVTLEGDIINPGGALTGGSKIQTNNNIFGRVREIKEILCKLSSLEKEAETKKLKIEILEDEVNDYEEFIEDKQKEYQDNHIQIMSLEHQLNQILEFISNINDKQQILVSEEKQLQEQISITNTSLCEYKNILLQSETSISDIQSKLNEFQNNMQIDKIAKEKLINEITDTKVKISALEQEKTSYYDNVIRLQNEINTVKSEIDINDKEINSLNQNQAKKSKEIKDIQNIILQLKSSQSDKELQIEKINLLKKSNTEILENTEIEIEEKIKTISLLEKEIVRIENQKIKITESRDNLYNTMWNEYELTYNSAKEYKDVELSYTQLQKENKQLKQDIKELGNINIDAIQEYKTISERFEFLTAQRNDIVETEEKLQKIIEDLTISMEKQFTEQFKLISENFSTVFIELFGGGKAYLKLSDNNILESGIDIIAQPPGKNLQNMMLLSGGERALTAIALLFAILKLKPSPFCILDEIEAALDDANVNRYAGYLRKFSKVTQFIVVTHRKGTMEVANVLYGVTMQEQGVSKLVSVKFEDSAIA